MKLFFKNDIRSFRGHTTSAIRLDSSLMPALKKRAKSSSRLASHGFRNCFGQVWINSGGIDDVRCMFTGGSLGRREATGTRLWIGFFLMGISCTVKCLLDRPLTEKKKRRTHYNGRPMHRDVGRHRRVYRCGLSSGQSDTAGALGWPLVDWNFLHRDNFVGWV